MSAATLLSWRVGHGLALETRGGLFEILADKNGPTVRLVNSMIVPAFESNSRTAQRLDQLFGEHEGKLRQLNELSQHADPTAYRAAWWLIKSELKGD